MEKKTLFFLILFIGSGFSQSWQNLNTGFSGTFRDIYFTNNDNGYVVCEGGPYEIFKTRDGGITWIPYPSNSWSGLHSVCFVNQDTGYAVGGGGGGIAVIRKTYDAGTNWDTTFPLLGNPYNWPALFSVSFPAPETGYAVGTSATGSGIIIKTTDAGQNWDSLEVSTDHSLWSVFFLSQKTGFAAGVYGTVIKTLDEGSSWNSQVVPVSEHLRSLFFVDSLTGFAVGDSGSVIKTENSGVNWRIIPIPSANDLNIIYFVNDSVGYIGGTGGLVLKTINGGTSWDISNSDFTNRVESVRFASEHRGFLVGYNGLIARSNFEPILSDTIPDFEFNEDSGSHVLINNLYDIFYDVDSPVLSFLPAASHSGLNANLTDSSLYISTVQDSFGLFTVSVECWDEFPNLVSDTFQVIINPVNDPPVIRNFPDTLTFFSDSSLTVNIWNYVKDVESEDSSLLYKFSIKDTVISYSYNGNTGELVLSSMGNYTGRSFLYISVTDDSNATALDTCIIKVLIPTGIEIFKKSVPDRYQLLQNYPNPFNSATLILFTLAEKSEIQLILYNALGQRIKTLFKGEQTNGTHFYKFEPGNLPTGIYYYRLRYKNNSITKKLLYLK
jgi:photosystem II stability/assembly factor-like uncharacterized protein